MTGPKLWRVTGAYGSDQDWIDAGTRRTAYYTNLPPGSYRFRVIALYNGKIDVSSEIGKGTSVTISLPASQQGGTV